MVKVKILILFAAISFATAAPMDQLKQNSTITQRDQQSLKQQYEILMTHVGAPENVDHTNTRTYRLPNNTIPLHYDISLRTNVHIRDFSFDGNTRINIRVLEASNTITLHARHLTIYSISLLNSQGNTIERNLPFTTENLLQFIVITTSQRLEVDQEITLEINYSAFLGNEGVGFYRRSYFDEESEQVFWYASTLFEPTNARLVFPCYDEIRYRTTFDIQIVHHRSYHALSNMPVARKVETGALVTTQFDRTPSMPVHNVAFIVSNFDFISNHDEELPINVYGFPASITAGHANNTLELSEVMLRTLEEVFEIPYPLPKSDMVALNIIANGESWGLIKIDDRTLLDNENDNEFDRQWRQSWREISVAHEYSVSRNYQPVSNCPFSVFINQKRPMKLKNYFS